MEILKYLDVLIGLAVVMLLLSPLVSAFTQLWLWIFNARSGRLQVGLKKLILELNGNPYERYDAAEITNLTASAPVTFRQPLHQPSIETKADANGTLILTQNIPAMLDATGGNLRNALQGLPANAEIFLRPRGSGADWQLTSSPTDHTGRATATYRFTGPAQFASNEATTAIPTGSTLTITIASGLYKGTQLNLADNVYKYPSHVSPVPAQHELEFILTQTVNPPPSVPLTLNFKRNAAYDQRNPLRRPVVLSDFEAEKLAEAVLLHPMIVQPPFWGLPFRRRGEVVQREELIRVLLGFGANPTAQPNRLGELVRALRRFTADPAASTQPAAANAAGPREADETLGAMQKLRHILAENDVPDPGRALSDIREAAQRLELTDAAAAAHDRLAKAILQTAQSSFVGRINNWFDQIMDRTTAEYKFRAQMVTVIGALFVASMVQLDSIDLLKRLSTDDKLRDSLVKQAEIQQKRVEDQAKVVSTEGDKSNAKALRDEIDANLAKLRNPQLAVLPDHFFWQPLPRGRLVPNHWQAPYSRLLELVVGGSVYLLEPQWISDPLSDIETAIRASGAPVIPTRDKGRKQYTITGSGIETLRVTVDGADRLSHVNGVVKAILNPTKQKLTAGNYSLVAGYDTVAIPTTADVVKAIRELIQNKKDMPVTLIDGEAGQPPTLQALKPEAHWLELRQHAGDPSSNVLGGIQFNGGMASYDDRLFRNAGVCSVRDASHSRPQATDCDAEKIATMLAKAPFSYTVDREAGDHLLLTAKRLGVLQLRSVPGKPETNMLNHAEERACQGSYCFDLDALSNSWRGVLLTWVLLSLGAPFWYDALKDMLKLRSSLAKKEEDARIERQTDSTVKTAAKETAK
jgi:hypothetical protein